jgi:hypothetical protein
MKFLTDLIIILTNFKTHLSLKVAEFQMFWNQQIFYEYLENYA